jgi:YVTN family beta-propeller protein
MLGRLLSLVLAPVCLAVAQPPADPVRAVTDPGVVVTRQLITPAGVQSVFDGRVYGVAFGASDAEIWVLNAGRIYRMDWRANRVLERIPFAGSAGLQGIAFDAAEGGALVSTANKDTARLLRARDGRAKPLVEGFGSFAVGAVAIAARKNASGQRIAAVPVIAKNKLVVIDLEQGRLLGTPTTGIAPFGVALSGDGAVAYVTNWGGRLPKDGEPTAPTGLAKEADRVVIDARGVAATGTVTKIDLVKMQAVATIAVGLQPNAIVWDEARHRLFVANGNSDSISVVDTRTDRVAAAYSLRPFGDRAPGVAPTALALAPGGGELYVACGGINAVAVLTAATGALKGLIPTAWYPNALALSQDGAQLGVATLLGAGSGWREEPRKRFVHSYRGSVSVIPVPDAAQLANYTTAVAENNHLRLGASPRPTLPTAAVMPVAIPRRAGEPSLIEHVVYIIKENRTYDQVFGAIKKGNGDPSLVMFGEDVTTNQHRLANEFVLLDNFYASGGNSGDGHQWLTQANQTGYAMWPGWAGRSYPFDGTDPIAYSSRGFLWDYALRAKKTVRVYGEFAPRTQAPPGTTRAILFERWKKGEDFSNLWHTTSPIPPLDAVLARNFPGYATSVPDVVRARLFLAGVKKWEAAGRMPNLVLLQLPSNHTHGAAPGSHSAKAMVADNDLALGQVVEGLTHTAFWKKMAIFVVEDDAQNGVDHVDGHRTVALAISPYTRRGSVDSTFYAHTSMVKTIELILGLPTMSIFDLIANDMRASFHNTPDYAPYTAVEPRQSLYEMNPQLNALSGPARRAALDSMKMRFDVPDAAPTERLNRILWHTARGWATPYPGVRRAVFAPLSLDLDDDER